MFENATPADDGDAQYESSDGSPRATLGKGTFDRDAVDVVDFVCVVRALYDYEPLGNNPGEMRLDEGDIIDLIEDVDEVTPNANVRLSLCICT